MKNLSGAICGAKHRNKWTVREAEEKSIFFFVSSDRLMKRLLDESSLKDRFYAELEVITQQIRRIPLPSAETVRSLLLLKTPD